MPSGKIKIGHRDHIINKKFFKKFTEDHPEINITYNDFVLIIRETNKEIARIVTTEQTGFKLPEGHGYIVVTLFKSKKKSIDLANSHKFGKIIYHLNLGTFGKRSAIRWLNKDSFFYYPKIYKFEGCRTFKRQVAKATKEGFMFLEWSSRDFIKFDKISKLQNSNKKIKWDQ